MLDNFDNVHKLFNEIIKNRSSTRQVNEDQYFELKTSALNKNMRYEMLKTVTAFLNSHEGGILFIGINDDKEVVGLEKTEDKFIDIDNYEQSLIRLIKANLHDAPNRISQNLRFHFLRETQKTVCAIEVRPFFPNNNEMIAWCEYKDTRKNSSETEKAFFKRTGTSTTRMTPYDVAMDMLTRRLGALTEPDAPEKDANGKPYKLFDEMFILLEVNPNVSTSKGNTKTELVLKSGNEIIKKYRNEDWLNTEAFISKAKSLIGKTVRLTSWKNPTQGDDFWWNRNYVANVYAVNAPNKFND